MMRHIEKPGIVRTVYSGTFRHIKGYLAILIHAQAYLGPLRHLKHIEASLRHIEPYSDTGEWGKPHLPIFDNKKICSEFGKNVPDCVHL